MTEAHPITDPVAARAFMFAGKATFTVRSEKTGEHLTFQVRHWKRAKHGTMHFVSVRTGNDYAKIGVVIDRGTFSHKPDKSDLPFDDKRVQGFRYVFRHLCEEVMPPKCEVWHEGVCGRCARPLTDPESIARGIGPDCLAKMGG
jgi:hypothetical protein